LLWPEFFFSHNSCILVPSCVSNLFFFRCALSFRFFPIKGFAGSLSLFTVRARWISISGLGRFSNSTPFFGVSPSVFSLPPYRARRRFIDPVSSRTFFPPPLLEIFPFFSRPPVPFEGRVDSFSCVSPKCYGRSRVLPRLRGLFFSFFHNAFPSFFLSPVDLLFGF